MENEKTYEELQFECEKLRAENEYIKKNLAVYQSREDLADTAADSRLVRFGLKVYKKIRRK